jgi:hypothetical protein
MDGVMAKQKLTPEELHTRITDASQLITGRANNIAEVAVDRNNTNLSKMIAEGLDVICSDLERAVFNLGNSETSRIDPELKEQMRREIVEGERYSLMPTRIVRWQGENADIRFQLRDVRMWEAFTPEELNLISAAEDVIRTSRLLAVGCAGLELPGEQKLSALELLQESRDLIYETSQRLKGKHPSDFYDGYMMKGGW